MTFSSHTLSENAAAEPARPPSDIGCERVDERPRSCGTQMIAQSQIGDAGVRAIRNAALDCVATAAFLANSACIVIFVGVSGVFCGEARAAERFAPLFSSDRAELGLFASALIGVAALIFLCVSCVFQIFAADPLELKHPSGAGACFEFSELFNALDHDIAREAESIAFRAVIRDKMSDAGREALAR